MEVVHDGVKIPVVVAVSKPGLMFFLDRETGRPVYPVEERTVPQSDVPGEQSWPTQPFPLKLSLIHISIRHPESVYARIAGGKSESKRCV